MKVIIKVVFFADYNLEPYVKDLFKRYGIEMHFPQRLSRIGDNQASVEVPIQLNVDCTSDEIKDICQQLMKEYQLFVGEALFFEFDDDDFKAASFFKVHSTGNSSKAFLEHKKDHIQWETICDTCGIKKKVQTGPIVMDTSKIGARFMVNVGIDYWVISEKLAHLLEQWNMTGYELKEVIHCGKKEAIKCYQLIVRVSLPDWSHAMQHYSFATEPNKYCHTCKIRGRIDFPAVYDEGINRLANDFYTYNEYYSNGTWAYKPIFISKRLRRLLIDHKITRDVRNEFSSIYRSSDWLLKPIFINDYN